VRVPGADPVRFTAESIQATLRAYAAPRMSKAREAA